jgi:hypothetical protein
MGASVAPPCGGDETDGRQAPAANAPCRRRPPVFFGVPMENFLPDDGAPGNAAIAADPFSTDGAGCPGAICLD